MLPPRARRNDRRLVQRPSVPGRTHDTDHEGRTRPRQQSRRRLGGGGSAGSWLMVLSIGNRLSRACSNKSARVVPTAPVQGLRPGPSLPNVGAIRRPALNPATRPSPKTFLAQCVDPMNGRGAGVVRVCSDVQGCHWSDTGVGIATCWTHPWVWGSRLSASSGACGPAV